MPIFCSIRTLSILISIFIWSSVTAAQADTAFFYSANPPIPELSQYKQVVIEPTVLTESDINLLKNEQTSLFAYISIGELKNPNKNQTAWVIDKNRQWQSAIVDVSNPQWSAWILQQRIPALISKGFDGLFLDTLDSYQLVAKSPVDTEKYQNALVQLVLSIKQTYPHLKLLFNRGFALLDTIGRDQAVLTVDGLVAESLYQTWDSARQQYKSVTDADNQWLLSKLNKYKSWGLPINVIDYVDPARPALARETVHKLESHGFSAWVGTPLLDSLAYSTLQHQKRRILFIYDSMLAPLAMNPAHTVLGNSFDYLGLRVDYHDIRQGAPALTTANRYLAVASWLEAGHAAHLPELEHWISQQLAVGTRLLIFNAFPFAGAELLQTLHLKNANQALIPPFDATHQDELLEASTRLASNVVGLQAIRSNADQQVLLTMRDSTGLLFDPVLIGEWGGMALSPYLFTESKPGFRRWVTDPVDFLQRALPNLPTLVADTSTENGRRILLSHVDGDGFISKAELPATPYSAEVCYTDVLKPYRLAHTVSVIEGEIGPQGIYPQQSSVLENIARQIYALDHVEAASHSYSHPFIWESGTYQIKQRQSHDRALNIGGYDTDTYREVQGSIDYINQQLLPAQKKVEVMLWTGDALPGEAAIEHAYKAGVVNVNGGNTKLTYAYPSTTGIYPQQRPTSAGLQIYAPVMNENIYTNEWLGPFYGFGKVIETFELTNLPRRYKPISIYWHFYSCTKTGSLRALHDVYDWALKQPHTSLFLSEFAKRVHGFQTLSIANKTANRYQVKGQGALRTLRAATSLGYPQPSKSRGLAGYQESTQGRYLHLSNGQVEIEFANVPEAKPYLVSANARLDYWQYQEQGIRLRLQGIENVQLEIANAAHCKLTDGKGKTYTQVKTDKATSLFNLKQQDTGHALLVC